MNKIRVIEAIRDYIQACPLLDDLAIVEVDFLDKRKGCYSIDPVPAQQVVEEDIMGNRTYEYPFAFTSREDMQGLSQRIDNNVFYEDFAEWMNDQTQEHIFPILNENQEVESIHCVNWGVLLRADESRTGMYQIMCKLRYTQESED